MLKLSERTNKANTTQPYSFVSSDKTTIVY